MATLRIDYNAVTALTAQMQTAAGNVQTTYESMKTTVDSLVSNGYMEAEAATAYVDNFTSLMGPALEDLNELITSFYNQLNTICDNFADADAKIAQAIRV